MPICSALRSRIMASQAIVLIAPAKRSAAVLRPSRPGSPASSTRKSRVDIVEDAARVGGASSCVGVGGVALLPEELGGAQEEARAQLPAHDVRPLVQQQRQIAIDCDPLRHLLAEDRLRGRPHDERLVELLAAGVRHHRELGAEALDVLGLAAEVALRDEQREVDVLGARAP